MRRQLIHLGLWSLLAILALSRPVRAGPPAERVRLLTFQAGDQLVVEYPDTLLTPLLQATDPSFERPTDQEQL
jgi:hypothetical protein